MTIRSRIPTDQYREEWERIFGKKMPESNPELMEAIKAGRQEYQRRHGRLLNPHDADEHPSAD